MTSKDLFAVFIFLCLVISAACSPRQITPTMEAGIPNPASVYCEENNGKLEFREDSSGGVIAMCVFLDGSECEEWSYFRRDCNLAEQNLSTPDPTMEPAPIAPTDFITPDPIDQGDYQNWWTYTNTIYGFSILLPPDWVVEEITTSDPLMNGHLLNIRPQNTNENINIRLTFRHIDDKVPLWPTGVGAGEIVPQGTVQLDGEPVRRMLFVCPTGQINAIFYQGKSKPNIQRGDLEFGFIFSYTGVYCQEDYSLGGKVQRIGEMIISSLEVQ